MALIVEDGTIVADANTYVSEADADEYLEFGRPHGADWLEFSSETKEGALRFATKLLDEECWLGLRVSPSTQELAWPRSNVWDEDRRRFFASNVIPDFLKCATYEFALALAREDRTVAGESAGGTGLKRAKIDVLELEWKSNSGESAGKFKPVMPSIVSDLICDYIDFCGGIAVPLFRT